MVRRKKLRQSMPCYERRNQLAMRDDLRPRHDQTTVRGAREFRDSVLNLGGVIDRPQFHPERWRHRLNRRKLGNPGG